MGQYAVSGRQSTDDRILVDHIDPGSIPRGNGTLSDQYRKCLPAADEPERKQSVIMNHREPQPYVDRQNPEQGHR